VAAELYIYLRAYLRRYLGLLAWQASASNDARPTVYRGTLVENSILPTSEVLSTVSPISQPEPPQRKPDRLF
jgi:hypothetical protein